MINLINKHYLTKMETNDLDYTALKSLFEQASEKNFEIGREKELTFFDVSEFPHYENVASNVLKFLFYTKGEHKFGDLWLKSLLLAYSEQKPLDIKEYGGYSTDEPIREYSNGSNKRIDLLIDCDSLIIVVENKIFHYLNNDLKCYTQMAENYIRDKKKGKPQVIKIVLSLFPVSPEELKYDFINITYEMLFEKIDSIVINYEISGKWAFLHDDFIKNLKKQKDVSTMKADKEWIELIEQNSKAFGSLIEKYESEIKIRLDFLKAINVNFEGYKTSFDHGIYNSIHSSYMSQYVNIEIDDNKIFVVETCLMRRPTEKTFENYSFLYILLWNRKDQHYDFSKELKILDKENAKCEKSSGKGAWGRHYALDIIDLMSEQIKAEDVAQKIMNYAKIIEKLYK